MKAFLKYFWHQTGSKALVIGMCIVVPIWTYFWSKQDGQFNYTMIAIGVGFLAFVLLMEFIFKPKQ